MHLDAETLERVLHGELDPRDEAAVRHHLASCMACESHLEEARLRETRLWGLLEELDHRPPDLDWKAVRQIGETPQETGWSARSRIAASLAFLLVTGGILYALPGSPVRDWIEDQLGERRLEAPTPGPQPRAPSAAPVSGLSIRPSGPFEIVFAGRQAEGTVRLEIVEAPDIEIRVIGTPVTLESGPDRLVVGNADSRASYAIRLPASGPSVRVRIGRGEIFRKDGADIRTSARREPSGAYVLDLDLAGP